MKKKKRTEDDFDIMNKKKKKKKLSLKLNESSDTGIVNKDINEMINNEKKNDRKSKSESLDTQKLMKQYQEAQKKIELLTSREQKLQQKLTKYESKKNKKLIDEKSTIIQALFETEELKIYEVLGDGAIGKVNII
eukprot:TRINITY_DN934_c0_g1_i1.p1 TRINITY_DN934_c0_g1~~TRINITY_DN934_c0_g1_i1.p1  ORF type:complete len:135 (+),score=43.26 TRINITY_DN934_c0_g1_i1:188-592(+)